MDRSEAVKKWKKDKPTLLTDTGVSDVLRTLPEDWTSAVVDLAEVDKALKTLSKSLSDKKISASKSATACLTEIETDVKKSVDLVKTKRARTVELMKEVHAICKTYHATCTSAKINQSKVDSFASDLAGHGRALSKILLDGRDKGVIAFKTYKEFEDSYQSVIDEALAISRVIEDSKSKAPKWDTKKLMASSAKAFKEAMDDMPPRWKEVENLS